VTLDPELLEIIVCPRCRADLRYEVDEPALYCDVCRLRFSVEDGIPILLVDRAVQF
jgi:uncharacterized protein